MKLITLPSSIDEIEKTRDLVDGFIIGIKDMCVNTNFCIDDLSILSNLKDKDIFISLNKNMHNSDLVKVESILLELNNYPIKGVLFYDIGVLNIYNRLNLNYDLVWTQEHLTTNFNTINYWYEVPIDSVIRDADNAVRVMIFLNGEKTIYAKRAANGEPEKICAEGNKNPELTTPFFSDKKVCVEERKNFEPGAVDKFTIVVWMEGDDPECLNDIIGGQVKMHMDITGEQIHE